MKVKHSISLAATLGLLVASTSVYSDNSSSSSDSSSSPTTNVNNIEGKYNCSYHDPFSTPNDGTETIVFKKTGDIYKVSGIPTGSVFPYYVGKGLYNTNINNAFGYIFWVPKSPTSTTVQIFTIKPDGSLDGIFADSNKDKSGTEHCTKATQ